MKDVVRLRVMIRRVFVPIAPPVRAGILSPSKNKKELLQPHVTLNGIGADWQPGPASRGLCMDVRCWKQLGGTGRRVRLGTAIQSPGLRRTFLRLLGLLVRRF